MSGVSGQPAKFNSIQQEPRSVESVLTVGPGAKHELGYLVENSSQYWAPALLRLFPRLLPCANNFKECISACGVTEFQAPAKPAPPNWKIATGRPASWEHQVLQSESSVAAAASGIKA